MGWIAWLCMDRVFVLCLGIENSVYTASACRRRAGILLAAQSIRPLVSGERERRADVQLSQSQLSQSQLSQSSPFQPVAAASPVRPASVAIAVGACIGAAATSVFLFDRALHDSTVSEKSAAADAIQLGATIGVQPKAVKPQLFAAEQTTQNNSRVTSSENTDAKRAEVQTQTLGESATDQPRCNVSLCESYYQSFRASDCTYQPYSGPRQYCAR